MGKLVIDGNSIYEIDEECIRKKEIQEKERKNQEETKKEKTDKYTKKEQ